MTYLRQFLIGYVLMICSLSALAAHPNVRNLSCKQICDAIRSQDLASGIIDVSIEGSTWRFTKNASCPWEAFPADAEMRFEVNVHIPPNSMKISLSSEDVTYELIIAPVQA